MVVLRSLRTLLLALFWPFALVSISYLLPEALGRWARVIDIAALALAASGALVAAGFSLWRVTNGFVLVALAGAGLYFDKLPAETALLPLPLLGVLPWLRERGLTGMPSILSGILLLVLLALWLRGGAPAEAVNELLTTRISLWQYHLPVLALISAVLLLAVLVRLLIRQLAVDVALAGALVAFLPTALNGVTTDARIAATSGAVLALWTGLLLHAWRMAYLDQLTGLPNRRALEDAIKALPGRWSVAMLDVDHFKKFNDKWGHDVGDQVLRRVAAVLRTVGERGRPFRYGGEEFSVIFPHDDLERARSAIDTVRQRMQDTPFQVRGSRKGAKQRGKQKTPPGQKITISGGVTVARAEKPESAFKRADQALYKAKGRGRNRVVAE